jgi:putative ABC transport system permease protein
VSVDHPRLPLLLRTANRLLAIALPRDDFEGLSGDLSEEFDSIRPRLGSLRAGLWYWGQTLRAVVLGTGRRFDSLREFSTSGWGKDARQAVRQLAKAPGFSLTVVLTLAIGIGANTAIFSFVNALLLRPLPYPNPDRLVEVYGFNGSEKTRLSLREVNDLKEQSRSFEGVAAFRDSAYNYAGDSAGDGGAAEHFEITRTTGDLFRVLGVRMEIGDTWPAIDDRSRSFEIVLTHELWERRFHSDPTVIGRQVLMDGFPNTITGVASREFTFPARVALFRCWGIDRDPNAYEQRDRRIARAIARLKPGVSFEQAASELASIAQRLSRDFPATNARMQFRLSPLRDSYIADVKPYLYLLLGAVGLVLLIACANVANLLLSKGTSRRRELSIRTALGASRTILVRQMIVESVVLSLLGGMAGLLLANGVIAAILKVITVDLPAWASVWIDWTVLLFLSGISVLTGVVSGVMPAIRLSRRDPREALAEGGRGSSRQTSALGPMVMTEVAFAAVLLAGAALMMQSFIRLQTVDLGFRTDRLLTFHVGLSWRKYNLERSTAFEQRALEGLRRIPGSADVAFTTALPLSGHEQTITVSLEGQAQEQATQNPLVYFEQVDTDFHRTMGIPLQRGRLFTDADRARSPAVALVSDHAARRLWPGQNPIGKRILPADAFRPWVPQWLTVVGVVGDVKHQSPASDPGLDIYIPFVQAGSQGGDFVIRSNIDPLALIRQATQVVASIDREEPASEWLTMDEISANTIWQRRIAAFVSAALSVIALLLATIGIYGVIAYSVNLRTKEIGIRSALGASAIGIVGMVMLDAARFVLPGIMVGVAISLVLARAVSTLLFGITPGDPATFLLVALLLLSVAACAAAIPAIRAAGRDPLSALRSE